MRPTLTDTHLRAAAADAGNRAMRAAGRTRWSEADYAVAAREYARLTAQRQTREARGCRQTVCKHCDLDIEQLAPFKRGQWMDRGGNYRCNGYGCNLHAPVPEGLW